MSSDLKVRVDSTILDKSSDISVRLASLAVCEKHVLRWVTGRPETRAMAASEKVHSRVERLGMEDSRSRRGMVGGSPIGGH